MLLAAIPALALIGRLQIGWLVTLVALVGLLALLHDAAFQAFVPRLVPRRLLTPAHARLDQGDAVAQASSPALAGGLVALLGAPVAVLVDASTFLVSGLLLTRVPVAEAAPPPPRATSRAVGRELMEGLRWVYRHSTLAALALSTHGWFFCSAIARAVLTPFALLTLGLSPLGLGLALAVAGIGAPAGSLAAVSLGARFGVGRVVTACRASAAVAWALVAASGTGWPGWICFGAGQLVLGLGMGAENANEMGYRQTVTSDRLQGRMNATMRSLNRAMIVVGAPIGGILGDALGFRTMLWVAAGGFLVVAVALSGSRFARVSVGTEPAPD